MKEFLDSGKLQAIIPPGAGSSNCRGSVWSGAAFVFALISKPRLLFVIDTTLQIFFTPSFIWLLVGSVFSSDLSEFKPQVTGFQINLWQLHYIWSAADSGLQHLLWQAVQRRLHFIPPGQNARATFCTWCHITPLPCCSNNIYKDKKKKKVCPSRKT